MAFEGLSERLEAAFKRLKSKGSLNEADVRAAMRDVRMALLEADVSYKVAKDFTAKVTERAIGADVMESLTPAQMVIKIVNEELIDLMGGTKTRLATAAHPPTVIMLCGLQGAGKTTHCAKLALMLKNRGSRPMLVACDIYRPAAIKQLQVLGEKVGVPVFEKGTQDPVETAKQAVALAKDEGNDYVLIDTAGRLHIDEQLMDELKRIKSEVRPHEILLVVDAMTGQDAVNVASTFNETLLIAQLLKDATPEEELTLLDSCLVEQTQTMVDIYSRFLFEQKVVAAQADHALDVDELKETMLWAQDQSYGDGLDPAFRHPYMWACKSHYYSPNVHFYNFPYAFGGLFARGLYARYEQEGEAFVPVYCDLLSRFGSDTIANVTASVGIDVTTPDFWRSAVESVLVQVRRFVELANQETAAK